MIDCKTCLDEKVLSYYGECAMCVDCSDDLKIYDYITQLKAERAKLREGSNEMKSILKDFLTTKENKETWISEMMGTIDAVLSELEGEK